VEAFDETLDKNIWALADQRLKLDQQIAVKRRIKPQEVETSLQGNLEKQNSIDDEDIATILEVQDLEMDLDDPVSDRYPRLQESVSNIAAVTQGLGQSVPIQVERSERVIRTAHEVISLQP